MKTRFIFYAFVYFFFFPFLLLYAQSSGQKELPPIDLSRVNINHLPYKFVVIRAFPKLNKYVREQLSSVNLKGDGSDNLLKCSLVTEYSPTPNSIVMEGIHPQAVRFQTNFYRSGGIIVSNSYYDVNNDGEKEIFVSEIKSQSTYLHIIDSEGKILNSFLCAASSAGNKRWDAHANVWSVMDINGDGWQDLLVSIEATYSFQPRGIYALDIHNKKFLWKYRTGFPPRTLILYDIDGDGKREILFGSASPANGGGVKVNGTDDMHTYLVVLDSLGHCLRKPQIVSGEFAALHLFAHDLNGDGRKEIVARFGSHRVPKENNFIALWNPATGSFGPRIDMAKDPSNYLSFLDADKNGKDDVLVGWNDGTIEFRNYNLETIYSRKFTQFCPLESAVADFNNDGEKEIIFSGEFRGRGAILILDRKMNLLAYLNRDLRIPTYNCIVSQGFGKDKLLLATGPAGTFVMGMEKQFAVLHRISWNWLAYGLLLGVLLSGFSFVLFVTKKSQKLINRELESVFDLLRVGLMALDSKGNVISSNRTMEQLLRKARELMIGTHYKKIFVGTHLKEVAGFIKSSYQGKPISIEKEITALKDGLPSNLLVNITLLSYGRTNEYGRLVSIRNITEVVDSKRVVAWAGMAQKLAHEIKTPLSTLMLSAQRLQIERGKAPDVNNQSEKYLQYIIAQVDRLRKMTDAFLKFARIEKPQLESVEINQIITESLEDFRLKIGSKVQVKKSFADNLPNIFVDRAQLIIAVQNLISNSLTAMGSEGVLTITTRLVQKLPGDYYRNLSDFVQIEISDTGSGISQEDLGQLFQPFFSRSAGGTGMGLVIVKKIVEDHNGTIRIESEEGIGTTVFLTIPVKR